MTSTSSLAGKRVLATGGSCGIVAAIVASSHPRARSTPAVTASGYCQM